MRELRPLFVPPDPCDRVEYDPGELAQCDLWFPPRPIPVGAGARERVLPVLAMTCGYSRVTDAVMIPSRRAGDILAGMWAILGGLGPLPADAGVGPGGRDRRHGQAEVEAASFAGTLGVRLKLAPPRDPESKGLVERRNGYFETSFLPGRSFTSPFDFNAQIEAWLTGAADARHLRSIGTSPADAVAGGPGRDGRAAAGGAAGRADRAGPAVAATTTCASTATTTRSTRARSAGSSTGSPPPPWSRSPAPSRSWPPTTGVWASGATITDPAHQATARAMRAEFAATRDRTGAPPAPTPTGTSWPCARCRTTTRCSAWTSTPAPTRPSPPDASPLKGSR